MRLASAQRTHAGGREVNEDAAAAVVEAGHGCWIVADGVGGHGRGELASSASVRAALDRFRSGAEPSAEAVSEVIRHAQAGVRQAQEEASYANMRTTIALLLADGRSRIWGHVGDTRIYSLRDGRIIERTLDHSVPQMLVEAGRITEREIRSHPERNKILRALGENADPEVEIGAPAELRPGDAYLLCTDGWWEYLSDTEIELDFAKSPDPESWLDAMMRRILTRARGTFDNLTAVAVLVE